MVLALSSAFGCTADDDEGGRSIVDLEFDRIALRPLTVDGGAVEDDVGETERLDGLLDGRPVVLNFFASTCTPCVEEMPAFDRVHADLGADVRFAGIAHLDRVDAARDLVASTGVRFETYLDDTGATLPRLGGVGLPTTAFVDASGEVVTVHTGPLTEDELRSRIEDVTDSR